MKLKNVISLATLTTSILLAKEVDVKIISSSDVHGRIIPWEYSGDSYVSGSFSQIDTYVSKEKKTNPNVILVDTGDAIQDNSVEKFSKVFPNPVSQVMNIMGYDIFVPGNHEFNFGLDVLTKYIDNFKGKSLASNLYYKKDGKEFLEGSTIIEKDGIKIGFIGVTTPLITQFEADTGNVKDLNVINPLKSVKEEVESLKGKVDAIVLIAHMGYDNENSIPGSGVKDIASAIPEIDVILSGHAHKEISSKNENGVLITAPYKYGQNLSIVDLKFDTDKKSKLVSKEAKTVSLKGVDNSKRVDKIYSPYHEKLREEVNIVIGETTNPLVPKDKVKGIPSIYVEDTGLATFLHNVMLNYSDAQVVALSLDRDDSKWEAGKIKKKDIAYNYRYTGGEITVYEFTGKDLKDYMEWSAEYFNTLKPGDLTVSFDLEKRSFKYSLYDQFGGVNYKIDLREEKGNRIKDLKLMDGTPIKADTKVKVGMNSYRFDMLAKKGGVLEGRNIPLLSDSKTKYGKTEGTIQQLSIKYIQDKKIIDGLPDNNWEIIGLPNDKNQDIAVELINSGKLSLPQEGRATNIKSITIDDIKNK
ncbi:MAG: 5'-nucleotidase C-terminal domain-containing protein [Cetobacterium sp.]|uniref:bifunctional metallophosphatase/5'-nucleotidase n=1 Tax=Cetobacterium sp. TaxID=2071632 RepID=UPI002FC822A5